MLLKRPEVLSGGGKESLNSISGAKKIDVMKNYWSAECVLFIMFEPVLVRIHSNSYSF